MKVGSEDVSAVYVQNALDIQNGEQRLEALASTIGAVATTFDTGYELPPGKVASLHGTMIAKDTVANTVRTSTTLAAIRNLGGVVVAGTPVPEATTGDPALATAAMTFGVSLTGTLTVTFTPPVAYPNALSWRGALRLTLL
jgi:hypothetical protein